MKIIVFGDGACLGNPGRGGWGAIVSVEGGSTIEMGGSAEQTTNNRMELLAPLSALEFISKKGWKPVEVLVHSDSKYFIEGISKWIYGWLKKSWKNGEGEDVKNQDLWKRIWEIKDAPSFSKTTFRWLHVEGHAGVPGNERCDEIASGFAAGESTDLFDGPTESYPIDLSVVSARPKGSKAYYLSAVDGEVFRDSDWPTCKSRVQGRSGVKYKKVRSEAEELEILRLWGIRPKT